jgi:hypothetical protein
LCHLIAHPDYPLSGKMGWKSGNADRSSIPFFRFLGRKDQRVQKWKNGTEDCSVDSVSGKNASRRRRFNMMSDK